ncbi:GTPase required for pre-60S ribosomal subunit nuclear export and maturation [Hypoxylon texense]
MPPLLPRPALVPRAASIAISRSRSAIPRALFSRTAASASSSSSPQQRIPPESPLFINVPNPPQDQSVEALRERKPVKGHLPVPRQVFKRRDGHLKPQDAWLTKSAPLPSSEKAGQPPRSDIQAWKRKMASSRRDNMRDGVRALYARKQHADRRRLERQAAALAANRAAALAPEREDERLTRGSVNAPTLRTAVLPDPERFERAAASRRRTDALAAQRSEARRDAIQELYMKARSFIVSERDLEAEVDRQFAPDYWKNMGMSAAGYDIQNIWDLDGRPQTVADMLDDVARSSNAVLKRLETEKTRTLKRQKEVAEELTGGKLDGI